METKVTITAISKIKANPNNPRVIKDDKFKKLVKSIQEFPKMMELRPIVVNDDMVVLGGNMRLKACKELGLKEVPVIKASDLTEDQQRQFIIKDNVGFGEWDWDMLANEWDSQELEDWGLDVPNGQNNDEIYTTKIEPPIYTPKGEKPSINSLYDLTKYEQILTDIEKSDVDNEVKDFLRLAATRHIRFNYRDIAEFYSHEKNDVQLLMEDSALVIIDFDKAIELGFVELYDSLEKMVDENE